MVPHTHHAIARRASCIKEHTTGGSYMDAITSAGDAPSHYYGIRERVTQSCFRTSNLGHGGKEAGLRGRVARVQLMAFTVLCRGGNLLRNLFDAGGTHGAEVHGHCVMVRLCLDVRVGLHLPKTTLELALRAMA